MADKKSLHQIANFATLEPPKYLKSAVFQRISEERAKRLKRGKILLRSGIFLSVVLLGISSFVFGKEIIASDFWSLASLSFTDMNIVAVHWQEFCLSLSETFPVEAVASILIPVFILLVLAKQYFESLQNYKSFYKSTNVEFYL